MADGALWVNSRVDPGIARLDPATNTVVAHLGGGPSCGATAVALGDLWQSECDRDVILRIDPTTTSIVGTIPAQGHRFLIAVGDTLVTVGPEGLAVLDPAVRTFTALPGSPGVGTRVLGSDGSTVWALLAASVIRVDLVDGTTLASFPYQATEFLAPAGDHAWLAAPEGVVEIVLATNSVTRTIPMGNASPSVAREIDGVLWATDFNNSDLWRIQP